MLHFDYDEIMKNIRIERVHTNDYSNFSNNSVAKVDQFFSVVNDDYSKAECYSSLYRLSNECNTSVEVKEFKLPLI